MTRELQDEFSKDGLEWEKHLKNTTFQIINAKI